MLFGDATITRDWWGTVLGKGQCDSVFFPIYTVSLICFLLSNVYLIPHHFLEFNFTTFTKTGVWFHYQPIHYIFCWSVFLIVSVANKVVKLEEVLIHLNSRLAAALRACSSENDTHTHTLYKYIYIYMDVTTEMMTTAGGDDWRGFGFFASDGHVDSLCPVGFKQLNSLSHFSGVGSFALVAESFGQKSYISLDIILRNPWTASCAFLLSVYGRQTCHIRAVWASYDHSYTQDALTIVVVFFNYGTLHQLVFKSLKNFKFWHCSFPGQDKQIPKTVLLEGLEL